MTPSRGHTETAVIPMLVTDSVYTNDRHHVVVETHVLVLVDDFLSCDGQSEHGCWMWLIQQVSGHLLHNVWGRAIYTVESCDFVGAKRHVENTRLVFHLCSIKFVTPDPLAQLHVSTEIRLYHSPDPSGERTSNSLESYSRARDSR